MEHKMRNFEAAERAFQAAIDLESDNSVALLELAQVQVAQGEHLRAADTFERAVKVCLLSIASHQVALHAAHVVECRPSPGAAECIMPTHYGSRCPALAVKRLQTHSLCCLIRSRSQSEQLAVGSW